MNESLPRSVLVVVRRDPLEGMRVAAGITVFGHSVSLVFAHGQLEITEDLQDLAELLDLADIVPKSLCEDPEVETLSSEEFATLVNETEFVINV